MAWAFAAKCDVHGLNPRPLDRGESRSKDLQTNSVMAAEEQGLATVVPENGVRGSRNELALRITRQDAALEVLETTIGEVVI